MKAQVRDRWLSGMHLHRGSSYAEIAGITKIIMILLKTVVGRVVSEDE
jgi:hypothetical protein